MFVCTLVSTSEFAWKEPVRMKFWALPLDKRTNVWQGRPAQLIRPELGRSTSSALTRAHHPPLLPQNPRMDASQGCVILEAMSTTHDGLRFQSLEAATPHFGPFRGSVPRFHIFLPIAVLKGTWRWSSFSTTRTCWGTCIRWASSRDGSYKPLSCFPNHQKKSHIYIYRSKASQFHK